MELVFRTDVTEAGAGELLIAADAESLSVLVLDQGLTPFPRGNGSITQIVLPGDPTFDDLLAATFAMHLLAGKLLPRGARAFAQYAASGKRGEIAGQLPLHEALEGVYLAVRWNAGDLRDPTAAKRFAASWEHLAHRIMQAAEAGVDPLTTSLTRDEPAFAAARDFLRRDYQAFRNDIRAGESWLVRPPGSERDEAGLLLRAPTCKLLRQWCRADGDTPTGRPWSFVGLHMERGQWLFWANQPLPALADILQQAEFETGGAQAWRCDGPSLLSPAEGSVLSDDRVLELVRAWIKAHKLRRTPRAVAAIVAIGVVVLLVIAALIWWRPASLPSSNTPVADVKKRGFEEDKPDVRGQTARGNLHLLSIGISSYRDPKFNLSYAHHDAEKIAAAFQKQKNKVFADVQATVLTNGQATREEIIEALSRLKAKVTQHDFTIVTLSGHGANLEEQNHFYFLPYDYDDKRRATTVVYWDDFKRYLGGIPGHVFLVVDTCHSGTVTLGLRGSGDPRGDLERQVRHLLPRSEQAMIVIAACLSGSRALENDEWGHGVLTLAFLEALEGKRLYQKKTATPLPSANAAGEINLKELDFYVTKRVRELAGGAQAIVSNHTGNVALDRISIAAIKSRED